MASTTGLKSQRVAPLLTLGGYVYHKRSTVGPTTYWRCIRQRKATVIELAGSHQKRKAPHNHELIIEPLEGNNNKVETKLKNRSFSTLYIFFQILNRK